MNPAHHLAAGVANRARRVLLLAALALTGAAGVVATSNDSQPVDTAQRSAALGQGYQELGRTWS